MKKVAIIGAGVVGLAIARALGKAFPDLQITIIDKNLSYCSEASRYNSGVVHSGIHLHPNSLKSRFAWIGSRLLILYCNINNIPFKRVGMIVGIGFRNLKTLIKDWKISFGALWELSKRAKKQNIEIQFLTRFGVRRLEPRARVLAGIYIPDVWMIDKGEYGTSLFWKNKKRGVNFLFGEEVFGIKKYGKKFVILTSNQELEVDVIINSAGVNADLISAMAGIYNYRITAYRGEYYEVVGEKKDLIKGTLIYPAVRPGSPGLGIHITKTLDGRLFLGPNAKYFASRVDDFSLRSSSEEFLDEARHFLPQLEERDLAWAFSGLRAKLQTPNGEADFIIKRERSDPVLINLIGIESPGLTSSLAIANYVCTLINPSI